jgi:uncharacterized membrane protein
MTKRTNNNLQTGQTIQWPKGQTTIYKQDRQYNDQKDKQQCPFGHCIVCSVCRLSFVLLVIALSVLFVDCCLSFWSLYCLSCLYIVVCPFGHCIVIYKQDRQYNDQKDKQQSTNRTDNAMTKRTNNNLQTGQTIQWPTFWSLYCLSCL